MTTIKSYPIEAVNFSHEFRLLSLLTQWKKSDPSLTYEMSAEYNVILPLGPESFAYIYFFGALVLFNVRDAETRKSLISQVRKLTGSEKPRANESYEMFIDPNVTGDQVNFDSVILKKFNRGSVDIVCLVIAQSTALEIHEEATEEVLIETKKLTETLQKTGNLPYGRKDLTKHIGFSMSRRNQILASFYVLEERPESVWDDPRLEKLFNSMSRMFDIESRYKSLDKKLTSIQDSLSLIVDMSQAKRTMLLEMWIVILIVVEIVIMISEHSLW